MKLLFHHWVIYKEKKNENSFYHSFFLSWHLKISREILFLPISSYKTVKARYKKKKKNQPIYSFLFLHLFSSWSAKLGGGAPIDVSVQSSGVYIPLFSLLSALFLQRYCSSLVVSMCSPAILDHQHCWCCCGCCMLLLSSILFVFDLKETPFNLS